MIRAEKIMLYRQDAVLSNGNKISLDSIKNIADIINKSNSKEVTELPYRTVNEIIEITQQYGLSGNLIHCYISLFLVFGENAFTFATEKRGETNGSVSKIALNDMSVFRNIFQSDFTNIDGFNCITKFKHHNSDESVFNTRIRDRISELSKNLSQAKDDESFYNIVVEFYEINGCGTLGLNKAFRINDTAPVFNPVRSIEKVYLDDLIGYDIQKKRLTDNTEDFLEGRKANNVLLYGDSGTGKSSSIKAILNQYYDQGLRMIEVYKHQFKSLSSIIEMVKDRNYKFIIYMDDLSFEDYEVEYKYLKAVIEGGLGKKPDNVLVYATSNRRHLVREKWSDKEDRREDLHTSDTVEEKLSLVNRFGVTICFSAPTRREYENIINILAEKYNINTSKEELMAEANKWVARNGSLSGRSATQFIAYILGQEAK